MKTCYIIAGPTASGKTALSVQLAKVLQTEILSADSRQCYRELNIGTAKPGLQELAAIPHHFINSHSIHTPVNAAVYECYALDTAEAVFKTHDSLIMTGGTGLYIKALTDGLDVIPLIPEAIQQAIKDGAEEGGLPWLQKQIKQADPLYYNEGEIQNPHRLMRALQVIRTTGRSIKTFQQALPKPRPFKNHRFAINLPRQLLYERINDRVDAMMHAGLLEEVAKLLPFKQLPALATVGYKELFEYLEGNMNLSTAVAQIKQHTRQYAKRQLTWFQKDPALIWLPPSHELEYMLSFITKNTQNG